MDRMTRRRTYIILAIMFILIGVFIFRLLKIHQTNDAAAAVQSRNALTYMTTVQAARGDILDRNGTVLVTDRTCYNIDIINFIFFSGKNSNDSILQLLALFDEKGQKTEDHLPISQERPYTKITEGLSEAWQNHFITYLRYKKWDTEMSAKNIIRRMREEYNVPEDLDDLTARRLLGVRYELDLRYCAGLDNYSIAKDVSSDTLASVLELSFPGVIVNTVTEREYKTPYAAHILGRIAPIDPEEWENYKALGYSMDAKVGREGLEKAFESYLHGKNGTKYTTVSADGTVLDSYYTTEPEPGNSVCLTIDINLQKAAEESLAATIEDIRKNGTGVRGEGHDAEGGAVVAIDCKTGDVLVSASYPTFDIATYSENFQSFLEDKTKPLYNRALQAVYNPGSIYKMVTGIAAIDENGCGRYRNITDRGVYRYYEKEGYTCNCHIYTSHRQTHGTINMMQAFSLSCNYYFYEVGREAGIDKIDKVAKGLGLGEKTGVELFEESGTRANPETKAAAFAGTDNTIWYGADTLQASIGQSQNFFTPMQMAQYCSTLANGGVRYKASFLHQIISHDANKLIETRSPEVLSRYTISEEAQKAYREGMLMAAKTGTANTYFKNYPVSVAAKTGTAQHGSGGSDNASFICYAPADDPQIAIVVYVEKGAQGGTLGQVAKAILDAYFASTDACPQLTGEYSIS